MDNTCEWLSFNSVKYCGKACYIRYCKIHLIILRNYIIYTEAMPRKGLNNCAWIVIGSTNICGKNCIFEYCKIHRAQLRTQMLKPVPCRLCGVGTKSESTLCPPCGGGRIKRKLIYFELIKFNKVLVQLLELNNFDLDK